MPEPVGPPAVPETVLAVHNRYRLFGGEDAVFDAETALLEARGHRVERFVVDNDQVEDNAGVGSRLRLAVETVWSSRSARQIGRTVGGFVRRSRSRPSTGTGIPARTPVTLCPYRPSSRRN